MHEEEIENLSQDLMETKNEINEILQNSDHTILMLEQKCNNIELHNDELKSNLKQQ